MTDMFFQILFIIVICLGIFLLASWCFSCLYTEWQLDAAERARKKQEEELQVVKEQDPDGTEEETNFIEETTITVDDIPDNKKIKKQIGFNVQIGDATLPSNQILSYSQSNDNKKNKMTNSQKQQQQFQQMQQANALKQQFPNLTLQDIQQHQMKQMQQAAIQQQQQRQLEQIKQKYPNLTAADLNHLQQLQAQQQNNLLNNSNNVSINVSNNNQHIIAAEIPTTIEQPNATTVEIVVEPQPVKIQQSEQQKLLEQVITAEIEKEIPPAEIVQPQQSIPSQTIPLQQISQQPPPQQQNNQTSQQENYPSNAINNEEVETKLLYRERKLEEYEFFKTIFEIIDLSHNLDTMEISESYVQQFEDAINEADSKKSKINWKLVPLLHATDHMSAIEEITVLLDTFLKSKFFKKINRTDKMQVIDQLLRSVLNIITKRFKCPAKKQDHQEDLLWIWNEIKDTLEQEKSRIKASKSSNQNINKPKLPPKPKGSINV